MQRKISKILPGFEYFEKGTNPKLLIHSGTHGDEFEVIQFVKEAVEKYEDRLPDFIFVPVVSPSAVSMKTRSNNNGKDLNRIFFSDSKDFEVIENIKIIKNHKFDFCITFHEDPEYFDYYIYDEGTNLEESKKVLANNQNIKNLGINLLNGVDDPSDPDLGSVFVDGYKKFVVSETENTTGMLTSYLITEGITKRILAPEIPGKLNLKQKEMIVDQIFRDLLCLN